MPQKMADSIHLDEPRQDPEQSKEAQRQKLTVYKQLTVFNSYNMSTDIMYQSDSKQQAFRWAQTRSWEK